MEYGLTGAARTMSWRYGEYRDTRDSAALLADHRGRGGDARRGSDVQAEAGGSSARGKPRSLHTSTHPIFSVLFVSSCLANGGLFLWSNLSVGATVWTTLCLTAECPTPTREQVFEFTLRSSVEAMW